MDLETTVAQTVMAARLLERALHEPEGWTLALSGVEAPAERTLTDDGVTFSASLPATCWLDREDPCLVLRYRDQVLGVQPVEHPGDGGFDVEWHLSAATLVTAR